MSIGAVHNPIVTGGVQPPDARARIAGPEGVPFGQLVGEFLSEMDARQQAVTDGVDKLITGEADNIHDVAISVAQADVAFRLFMEVRDQLINAYQEVMRMQV